MRTHRSNRLLLLAALFISAACASSASTAGSTAETRDPFPRLDSARLISDLTRLSHDSMAGRNNGSPEAAKTRAWLVSELQRIGIGPVGASYEQTFVSPPRRSRVDSIRGANVIGLLRGAETPDRVIVISAHYDHVGVRDGQIFNGADDNASGTAAVLALAAHFKAHPPKHSIAFVFFDAEELGLVGARAFVAAPPIPLASIGANVNMDMVSRSDKRELYAAGAGRYPQLRPLLDATVTGAPVPLLLGHDSGSGRDDWTNLSDQGAFHAVGIPFVLFSVEDHADYHTPRDDADRIQPDFFYGAVRTIASFVERLDAALPPRSFSTQRE